jgi:hypothetical protein
VPEEWNVLGGVAGLHAIDQQRDQMPGRHRLLDRKHQRRTVLSRVDHVGGDRRIQRVEQLGHRRVVADVHHHADDVVGPVPRQHAHHFEAAKVRAEKQHAATLVELGVHVVEAGDGEAEQFQAPTEQEHPIQDGRGERMDVARAIGQRAGRPSTRSR